MLPGNEHSPLYEDAESFGLFPIYQEGSNYFVLVIGIKESRAFSADLLDLILRMVGALRRALKVSTSKSKSKKPRKS